MKFLLMKPNKVKKMQTNTDIDQTAARSEAIQGSSKAVPEPKSSQEISASDGLIYKPDQYGRDRDQYGRLAQCEDPDLSPEGRRRQEEWARKAGLR